MKTFPKWRKLRRAEHSTLSAARIRSRALPLAALSFLLLSLVSRAADSTNAQLTPPILTNRITVAILGFENKTGDASNTFWHFTVEDLVGGDLYKVKSLRILPGVNYALRQIHKKSGDALSAAEAAQVGNCINAHRVIWGSYDRKNGKWLVTARVLNPATGKLSADLKTTSPDWYDVRDQIVKKILGELAVRPADAERKKMHRRATSSPTAFEYLARSTALRDTNGPLAEAENLLRRAVAADTNYASAQLDLGLALFNRGDLESGEKSVRRALQSQPDYAYAHCVLGQLFGHKEEFESAETELLAAIRIDSDTSDAWELLGEVCRSRRALDMAKGYFNIALLLNPWSADTHARLGEIYAEEGLHDQAVAELKQAEFLQDPDDATDQQGLATSFDVLHEIPSAITHYENLVRVYKAADTDPKYTALYEKRLKELKETLTPIYVSSAQPKDYDGAALSKILTERLSPLELTLVTNPLASTPEMDRWAHEITAGATNDLEKAQLLFNTLSRHVDEGTQGWRTAQETFAIWQTPGVSLVCQDYAFLYVALSRHVGLSTYVVHVEKECDGHTSPHACAALFIGGKVLLVDPMYRWFGAPHKKFTVLNDLQALAVYMACRDNVPSAQIALKLAPGYEQVQFYAAYDLINQNQLEAARKVFPAGTLLNAQGPQWDEIRAWLAMREGHEDEAIALLNRVIGQNPDCYEAYEGIGSYYVKRKKWAEARSAYQQALEHCPITTKANFYRASLAEIDETIGPDIADASGPVYAIDYVNRGDARARRAEFDEAIADYSRAIELNPKSAAAFLHRSYCFISQGNSEKALADLQEAVRIDPKGDECYKYLGYFYEQRKEPEEAVHNYEKAIELGTHAPDVYGRLAVIYMFGPLVLRDNKKGLELARKACVLSNWKESLPIATLASAYFLQNDNDAAVSLAKMALSLPDITEDNKTYLQGIVASLKDQRRAQPQSGTNISASDFGQINIAAESGAPKAQVELANLLYSGKGVPVDHVEAYKWAAVAASKGDHDGTALQREFDLFMSPAEVTAGKAAAAAFLKEKPK